EQALCQHHVADPGRADDQEAWRIFFQARRYCLPRRTMAGGVERNPAGIAGMRQILGRSRGGINHDSRRAELTVTAFDILAGRQAIRRLACRKSIR
ncbi:MAG: hypothetical protein OEM83_09560, partial [Gammaproteobacteria bacterium]|nr:hypothetical protein [Gammaproteobacteria bacterium]